MPLRLQKREAQLLETRRLQALQSEEDPVVVLVGHGVASRSGRSKPIPERELPAFEKTAGWASIWYGVSRNCVLFEENAGIAYYRRGSKVPYLAAPDMAAARRKANSPAVSE